MKHLIKLSLVVLAGCGVGAPEQQAAEEVAYPKAQQESVPVVAVPPSSKPGLGQRLERPELTKSTKPRDAVKVTVKLEGFGAREGQQFHVVVGMIGCGFWLMGQGSVTISGGVAQVSMPEVPAHTGAGLFITSRDAAGNCTAWEAQTGITTTDADLNVTIPFSSLTMGESWLCQVIE